MLPETTSRRYAYLKIAVGSDHAGYKLKEEVVDLLRTDGYDFKDFGTFNEDSVDYPDVAREVAEAVTSGDYDRGILVCGTGIGMCITANKVPGIRAALCFEQYMAKVAREHNDANILVLGGRTTGVEIAKEIVRVWLNTSFDPKSRHARRVAKIEPHSNQGG